MEEGNNQNPNATITNRNLNDLPEELLLHILALLPTLESIQTSLISRKWQPLWPLVPSLNFLYERFPLHPPPADTREFFAKFIDRVLVCRCNESPIHDFRFSFIYDVSYQSRVDSWLYAAVHHLHARELHLDLFIKKATYYKERTHMNTYYFPFSVLRDGCVEVLRLTRCSLTVPATLSSTMPVYSIRSLFLDQVYFTQQIMRDLISGCPNLETLELRTCFVLEKLKICSKRIKRLILGRFTDFRLKETVVVDCPNLYSISFQSVGFDKFVLMNATSLVEFRVDVLHLIEYYGYWSKVVKLLGQAPNVKHLKVQNWWFKLLTSKDPFPKSFLLQNLNLLELRTGFTQCDLLGMAALLKLCPNLETMIIDNLETEEDESLSEELLNKPVDLSMPSLKQVTIASYTGTEDEVDFVTILLSQGAVLEKIVLVPPQAGEDSHSPLRMVIYRKRYKDGTTSNWMFYTKRNSMDSELDWGTLHWPIPSFLTF